MIHTRTFVIYDIKLINCVIKETMGREQMGLFFISQFFVLSEVYFGDIICEPGIQACQLLHYIPRPAPAGPDEAKPVQLLRAP